MSEASSGAICSEVYFRAPAALSIMIRELCTTSSRAMARRNGVEATANRPTPTIATNSSNRLNFALTPIRLPQAGRYRNAS
jgi:hypothetical protein